MPQGVASQESDNIPNAQSGGKYMPRLIAPISESGGQRFRGILRGRERVERLTY